MPQRNRTIHNIYGVFAGPAPATGYHFINESGQLNNNVETFGGKNFNLIKNLQRIQSLNYSVTTNETNVVALGKKSFITRENINPANINLSLNYLQNSIINELRLGFYANYLVETGDSLSGSFYPDNFNVCLLSGFYTRSADREINDLSWPMKYRDQRNIFAVINDGNEDLNKQSSYSEIDTNSQNYGVYGFGNCYLNSYGTSASVGSFPFCSVSFECDNMAFFSNGSGSHIPAVNTNREMVSGVKFAVPTIINESPISVLRPGDITLNISSHGEDNNILAVYGTGTQSAQRDIENLGSVFTGININNYNISLSLSRTPYQSFGEKIPHDRYIKFPAVVNCSFGFTFNEPKAGSIIDELNQNNNYDFEINLKNPNSNLTAVKYNIKKAKFNNLNTQVNINNNTVYNLEFSTEIDNEDYSKGLFISGLINNDPTTVISSSYLLQENGDLILQENDDRIIVRSFNLFY